MKHRKSYSLPESLGSESSGPKQNSSTPAAPAPPEVTSPQSTHLEFEDLSSSRSLILRAPTPGFVELLARSNFSFLQGASHPEEMVLRAKKLGYKGLALCDANGLYGVVRAYQAAEKPSAFDATQLAEAESEPDIDIDVDVDIDIDTNVSADRASSGAHKRSLFQSICGAELTPYDGSPVALLPMNKDGYTRLCHLITRAKRRAPKGHIALSLKDLLAANEDLIALPLPPWKEPDLKLLQNAFQDRIYLPVHKDFTWESVQLYQQALRIERDLGIPLFATQRPLFHEPERKPLHDVLTCILHKMTLPEAATRLTLNGERYLKAPEQIAVLFRERPDMVARTLEIASRISFSLTELRYRYPQENLPAGRTATDFLRELVERGLEWRYPAWTPYELMAKVRKQVEHELKLIQEMEYEDYFLTLWDICQFARSKGILHQGRGSAANSVVCFALGLTSVDPIKLNLLFERFISRERGEPPDIDIDFEHERREEVIQYVYRKYGARRAAMVCTVICYRSRMAIREVAKVMGVPLPQIDALIKFMGREGLSRLLQSPVDIAKFGLTEDAFQKLLKIALEMQGFPRHLGIHTGGFVISHEPVIDIVPVESASMDDRYVIQWNKDDINILGLMKIDLLALGMLSAVRKCLELLEKHKGISWNLAEVPSEDRATYEMIQKADTVGVFQIESRAQMSLLPRLKPRTYYDLVISVAIVRPGPIQGGMVHPFLRRRAGRERVTYAHPSLVPILSKTLGVPLFQEQVMQIAVAAAGFTPGEADELRRIISSAWKKQTLMDGLRQRVLSGMLSNGISREYADQIYKTIEGFSSYGFPESHAASFALITYVSCYFKHHHPDAFACALLNSQPMGFYSPRQLIADAQRHGVHFLPLDIQSSAWDFEMATPPEIPAHRHTPSGLALRAVAPARTAQAAPSQPKRSFFAVRIGFRSVYGLREDHARVLIDERQARGPYRDLTDLIRRTHLPKHVMIRLAAAGALACFGLSSREAMWVIQGLSFDPQSLLFGSNVGLDESRQVEEASVIPAENEWQSVRREYQTKGFSLEGHPMSVLRPQLIRSSVRYVTAQELQGLKHRTRVRVAGLMSLLQKPPTAKGMCFISLEDETGLLNVIVTPDLYQQCRLTLMSHPLLEVDGWLESRDGVRNVKAQRVTPLIATNTATNIATRSMEIGASLRSDQTK